MLQSLKKLFSLFSRRDKKLFLLVTLGSIFISGLEMITVGTFYPIITISIKGKENENSLPDIITKFYDFFNIHSVKDIFNLTVFILIFLYLFKNTFAMIHSWYSKKYANNLERKISVRLFKNYLNTPYSRIVLRNTPEIIRNISSSVNILNSYALQSLISLFNSSFIALGFLVLFIYVDIIIFFLICIIIGGAFMVYKYSIKKITKRYSRIMYDSSIQRNQSIIQAIQGFKETKIFQREGVFINNLEVAMRNTGRANTIIGTVSASTRSYLEVVIVCSVLILLLILYNASKDLSDVIIKLSIFTISIFRILPAIMEMYTSYPNLIYSKIHIDSIYQELFSLNQQISKVKKNNHIKKLLPFKKHITLKNISFKYGGKDNENILKNISITIHKNETIGIVGGSGAGKTTLVDNIIGLLSPQKGRVMIDGVNIINKEHNWWGQIGYIPQSIYLVDTTIKENIAFGVEYTKIDTKRIKQCIKLANLEEFINTLNEKEDTLIGENGVRLSGGQRQRLGIARALYNDPNVLVFDEATASLDTISESEIMKSINDLSKNNTIIIIAHRLSTIKRCDKIFVMKKGEIEDNGTYQELAKNSPTFKKILEAAG